MKIIFLDCDGVLNHYKCNFKFDHFPVDTECVNELNRITDKTKAKIVVSSSWRIRHTLGELIKLLKSKGITGDIVGRTPNIEEGLRGKEIIQWLRENDIQIYNCIAIDDDSFDMNEVKDNLIKTNFMNGGLTKELADLAIMKLNNEEIL